MTRRTALCPLVASLWLAACSGGESASGPAQAPPADAGSDATSVPDAAVPKPKPIHASIVAETEAGRGPALVRFFNDTPETLTYYLAEAMYLLVGPYTTTARSPAASGNVFADSKLQYHTVDNLCFDIKLDSIPGAQILEPGRGYTFHVTKVAGTKQGYEVEMLEDELSPEPYIAVRAQVPGSGTLNFTPKLTVDFAEPMRGPLELDIFGVAPTSYRIFHMTSLEIQHLEFVDRAKKAHAYSGSLSLSAEAARGFTIVFDYAPVAGAPSVELTPLD